MSLFLKTNKSRQKRDLLLIIRFEILIKTQIKVCVPSIRLLFQQRLQ